MNRLIQRNRDAINMPDEERRIFLSGLLADLIRKIDYINADAFTTTCDFSVGFMEDLIKKDKMFNQEANRIKPGIPNKCFDNCMKMSNNRLKIYMGYALTDNKKAAIAKGYTDVPEHLAFFGWALHCWLVDKKTGEVIETCPGNGVISYFGFQVNKDYIKNWVKALQRYSLTSTSTQVDASGGSMCDTVKNSEVLGSLH